MKVSADTITGITSAPGFHPGVMPPAPTRDDLIQDIRQKLQDAVTAAENGEKISDVFNAASGTPDYRSSVQRMRQSQKQFEDLINNVPAGFQLVPVFYSRIDKEQNARLQKEFSNHVRPYFMQYLAENHAEALRALGVCERGIHRMKNRLDPVDDGNNYYEFSVDHIIERSGSGNWGRNRLKDPDNGKTDAARHHVNHFDNFILLPDQIHQFKNDLNALQRMTELPAGQGRWVLMMIPDAAHAYVCKPQPAGSRFSGVNRRADTVYNCISRAAFAVDTTMAAIGDFRQNPIVGAMLKTFTAVAAEKGRTLLDAANDQHGAGDKTISQLFNAVLQGGAMAEEKSMLDGMIKDAGLCLSRAFKVAVRRAGTRKGISEMNAFADYMHGEDVKKFKEAIHSLPAESGAALLRDMAALEDKLAEARRMPLKPSNGPPSGFHAHKRKRHRPRHR